MRMKAMLRISTNAQWEVSLFQDDLIAAETMDDLLAAKARFDEAVRIKAMDMWKADGQYAEFETKVKRLKRKARLAKGVDATLPDQYRTA